MFHEEYQQCTDILLYLIMKIAMTAALLSMCLLGGCSKPYSEPDLPYEDEIEQKEYSIYSLSIENIYMRNLLSNHKSEIGSIVIISQTNELNEYWRDKLIDDIENENILEEAIEDWKKENESTRLLQRKFDLSYKYHLVTRTELDGYEGDSFFREFYKRYPNSNGLISVSKIGFDKARNTALIHVIHSYGALGARYDFITLERTDSTWGIVRRISTGGL